MLKLYKDGQCPSMMIVAFDSEEQPALKSAARPIIRTGSGISALSTEHTDQIPVSSRKSSMSDEALLAIKLHDEMKLGTSFEECIRIAKANQCDESASIKHLFEKT